MSDPVVTNKVRFSYVSVFQPREALGGGEPKYSITVLIPKTDTQTMQRINAAIQKAISDNLATTFGGVQPPAANTPVHDGDGLRQDGTPYGAECKGHWVINASTKMKPEVVDSSGQHIMDQSEVYSGCYGRVSLRFYAYNKAGRKGVGCGLGNVQKLADGEPLGGKTTAAEDFGTPIDQIEMSPDMKALLGL